MEKIMGIKKALPRVSARETVDKCYMRKVWWVWVEYLSIVYYDVKSFSVFFFIVFVEVLSSAECLVDIYVESNNTGWKTINPSIGLNGQRYCIWWFALFWNKKYTKKTTQKHFKLYLICFHVYFQCNCVFFLSIGNWGVCVFLLFECCASNLIFFYIFWQTIKYNWIVSLHFFFIFFYI